MASAAPGTDGLVGWMDRVEPARCMGQRTFQRAGSVIKADFLMPRHCWAAAMAWSHALVARRGRHGYCRPRAGGRTRGGGGG